MFPLSDGVWGVFLRGLGYGFFAGIVLIGLFLRSSKYSGLVAGKPIGSLYFLVGLEIGIALIGTIAFAALHAWQGWGQRMVDQSKPGA
jgi:hypothetical protein